MNIKANLLTSFKYTLKARIATGRILDTIAMCKPKIKPD